MDKVWPPLLITGGVASIFYLLVKLSLGYWKRRGILHEKPTFLFGNIHGVGSKQHLSQRLLELREKYKHRAPFIGFYAYTIPMIFVQDLDVIKRILVDDSRHFTDRGLSNQLHDDPLLANPMHLEGSKWHKSSTTSAEIFSKDKLRSLVPELENVADTFKVTVNAKLRNDSNLSISALVDCYNLDCYFALAFNTGSNSQDHCDMEFRTMLQSYMSCFSFVREYLSTKYPLLARLIKLNSLDIKATSYFINFIEDKIQKREMQPSAVTDFLQSLIDIKKHPDARKRINNVEIAVQSFSFLQLGLQASNNTLSFCLYELALQPELQEVAYKEIAKVKAQYKAELTYEALSDMQFMRLLIYETLRKYSPYPLLLRRTVMDYEVPNSVFMIAKDNDVLIPVHAIHHDAEIFPQPERFDPYRFLPSEVAIRHPACWLPFGLGPRSCVAKQYSMIQMLVGLVTMLTNFSFSPSADTTIPMEFDTTQVLLTPRQPIKLNVTRRECS